MAATRWISTDTNAPSNSEEIVKAGGLGYREDSSGTFFALDFHLMRFVAFFCIFPDLFIQSSQIPGGDFGLEHQETCAPSVPLWGKAPR